MVVVIVGEEHPAHVGGVDDAEEVLEVAVAVGGHPGVDDDARRVEDLAVPVDPERIARHVDHHVEAAEFARHPAPALMPFGFEFVPFVAGFHAPQMYLHLGFIAQPREICAGLGQHKAVHLRDQTQPLRGGQDVLAKLGRM